MVTTGLEVLLGGGAPGLRGRRVGLVTNHTGVDRRLRSGVDLLMERDDVELDALFGPEHGLRGEAAAGDPVATETDPRTGLPVHSLYAPEGGRRPPPSTLAGLDALLVDLQDAGARFYTYLSTLVGAQAAAAEAGVELWVLDRPNPLGGIVSEGPVLDPRFVSFVGAYPVPVRHALTFGEVARLAAAERALPEPQVVPMEGWERRQWYDETGLPWVPPSPGLPTLTSATVYPGACLLEGTNLSEGRGTALPFELAGAPWIEPHALAEELERRAPPGVLARPCWFMPRWSKHADEPCGGVQLHITDRDALRPVALGLELIDAVRSLWPERFAWRTGTDGRPWVDLLLGTDAPRRALEAGEGVAGATAGWAGGLAWWEERRAPYLLY